MFKYNLAAVSFNGAFKYYTNAQIPSDLFCDVGDKATRFLNQSIDFTDCFYSNDFYGAMAPAPDLWNYSFGSGSPTTTNCFAGMDNSTRYTNYASIPTAWGGVA